MGIILMERAAARRRRRFYERTLRVIANEAFIVRTGLLGFLWSLEALRIACVLSLGRWGFSAGFQK